MTLSTKQTRFDITQLHAHLKHQRALPVEDIVVFGANIFGEFGIETQVTGNSSLKTFRLTLFQQKFHVSQLQVVAAGHCHALFSLAGSKQIFVCGNNQYGQLGIGEETTVVLSQEELRHSLFQEYDLAQIVCGPQYTLCLTTCGQLIAFGQNYNSQLGMNSDRECVFEPTLVKLPDENLKISAVYCGHNFTFFLSDSNILYGCGSNTEGQLGISTISDGVQFTAIPSFLPENHKVKKICCGYAHTAILSDYGSIWLAGDNKQGQIGLESARRSSSFVKVSHDDITEIACGDFHTLFMTKDGSVYGCGHNSYYQIGIEKPQAFKYPTKVESLSGLKVRGIFAGGFKSFFTTESSEIIACGYNYFVGLGIHDKHENPKVVKKPTKIPFKSTWPLIQLDVERVIATVNNTYVIMKQPRSTLFPSSHSSYGFEDLSLVR